MPLFLAPFFFTVAPFINMVAMACGCGLHSHSVEVMLGVVVVEVVVVAMFVVVVMVNGCQVVDKGLAVLELPPVRLLNRPLSSKQRLDRLVSISKLIELY